MAVCFFVLAVSRERIPAFVQITLQFSYILTRNGIPAMLSSAITSKVAFLLALNLLLLFLGMIMDAGPIILIVAPIIYPVAMSFGIDPVQLGCPSVRRRRPLACACLPPSPLPSRASGS